MTQQHETLTQELSRKLEESVTTVTLLNALFVAMPQGVHPYFQVQLSAVAQALAGIAHCPFKVEGAQQLVRLATELAVVTGQLEPQETTQTPAETEAVNEAVPPITAREQSHQETLKTLFPDKSKE